MTIWNEMKAPSRGQYSLRLIQTCSYGSWSWIKDSDERVGVALELPEAIELDGFPQSKFLVVKSIANASIPNVVAIICHEPIFFDIFEILCRDLVSISTKSRDLFDAISLLKERLNSWIELFKKMRQLSLKEVYGLIAELKFLEIWIASGQQIDTWLGPHQSPQDFISTGHKLAVEVKATSANYGAISISSLEQLDFNGRLFLVVFPIANSSADNPNSISLNGLIEIIKQKLSPQFLTLFNSKLTLLGYSKEQEVCDLLVQIDDPNIYSVNQEFPRVVKSEVHGGIINCSYEINAIDCQRFSLSRKRLFEEIKS